MYQVKAHRVMATPLLHQCHPPVLLLLLHPPVLHPHPHPHLQQSRLLLKLSLLGPG